MCQQEFHWHFEQGGNWFSQVGITVCEKRLVKPMVVDGQTGQAKSTSQPVNLPCARPSMKSLLAENTVTLVVFLNLY